MEGINSVAIVGAGAAGLIFAQVLLRDGITVTVYESQDEVGGVWNYHPHAGSSAMYESLRTNLPKEIMAFNPCNLFNENGESFISHREVQEYLVDFSRNHHLRDHIRFATTVTGVRRNNEESGLNRRWSVLSVTATSGEEHTDTFDSVVICNGHFNVPNSPVPPPGLSEYFKGMTAHSVNYDVTKPALAGKRVLVVGSNSSGTDVARELLTTGARVWISARSFGGPDSDSAASTMPVCDKEVVMPTLLPAVSHVQPDGAIVFADGTVVPDIDAIVWCTGYLYDFPFLPTCEHWEPSASTTASAAPGQAVQPVVAVEGGRRVRPLYQQLFHVDDPTLVFAGLPFRVVPFPLFYFQAEYAAAVFQGRVVLPNLAHRYRWLTRFEANLKDRRFYDDKYHFLGDGTDQWEYCRCLARVAGLPGTVGDAGCCKTRYHALTHIAVMEAIYDDNAAHRFREPGAPDYYRGRHYAVDWPAGTWSVADGSN